MSNSFFEMDNVVYASFAIEILSIVDTFFYDFLDYDLSTYVDSELCI